VHSSSICYNHELGKAAESLIAAVIALEAKLITPTASDSAISQVTADHGVGTTGEGRDLDGETGAKKVSADASDNSSGSNKNVLSDVDRSVREAMHVLFVALGDISRYKAANYSLSSSMPESGAAAKAAARETSKMVEREKKIALVNYKRAQEVAPWVGAVFKPLAKIARSQQQAFHAIYLLLRSLCTPVPLVGGREALLL
jgi:hypothetical protein